MIEYQFASKKGDVKQGDLISNPWQFGDPQKDFTGAAVVESEKIASVSDTDYEITPMWNPVAGVSKVVVTKEDGTTKKEYTIVAVGSEVADTSVSVEVAPDKKTFVINFASGDSYFVANSTIKYGYVYDNVVVPQNDLPMIKAEMKSFALVAKARRIAVEKYAA